MIIRTLAAVTVAIASLMTLPGCAVTRGQETVGSYVDDAAITTAVKAKFVEDKTVDASSIKVETLHGTVLLSGFAKNEQERAQAAEIARESKGVKAVKNSIVVRPATN